MDFRSLKNIDSAFKQVKLFAFTAVILVVSVSLFAIWQSYNFSQKAREKIYVLDGGKSLLLALQKDIKDNRDVEAKDHIKHFHELFYTLDPDNQAIERNMNAALFLADNSAKAEYENLKENGFYNSLIHASASMEIQMDSIVVDFKAYPYYAKYYGTQQIIRPTNITKRHLISECYLRNVTRTENNSHGFLMEKWVVLDNKDVETISR
jgi:conjugative transposon TraK protein